MTPKEKKAMRKAKEALALVDEVWTRSQVHPDVNFLGDDEHEAWGAVKSAMAALNDVEGGNDRS